ncbi:hypothetical protein ACGFK1_11695 [Mycobacterium sp. NPDC048908]|uniref:hypothetical protein n=1 Tax=Mycobacterium sp. NPDC048908 TaxID=3364292 RepID=UPI003719C6A7
MPTFRIAAAAVGAMAVAGMALLSVLSGGNRVQSASVVPEHFGGPVDTSIYNPAATLSMPTVSSSATDAPSPMSARG